MKLIVSRNNDNWSGILLNQGKLFYTASSFKSKDEAISRLSEVAKVEVDVEEGTHPIIEAMHGIINGTSFDLPKIDFDFSGFTNNEVKVLKELLQVPAGEVVSYGELAKRVGIPHGARFVGNVMMKNRFGPIIPCHRVIRANGDLGKFAGKLHHPLKEKYLKQEKAI